MPSDLALRVLSRIRRIWKRLLPHAVLPLWVRPGLWWIARNDALGDQLFVRAFEVDERAFVARFVTAGMTVVDVGANAGLYAVISAKRVGPGGRVVAFEPSPRELSQLRTHLRLNRCSNVTIEEVALGEAEGQGNLLIVDEFQTGCNSFHLAEAEAAGTHPLTVPIRTLDSYYRQGKLTRVDLIKIDIEGAELSALRGGAQVFRELRPVLLCEIFEERTEPWNYRGLEIIELVRGWGYDWFSFSRGGKLEPVPASQTIFGGNFVAFPRDRVLRPS